MKLVQVNAITFVFLLLCGVGSGCSKSSGPPPALPVEPLPTAFGKTFKQAKPEIKNLADAVVASVQTNGYASAYTWLQNLSAQSGLTREQASLAARALVTINGLANAAAAKGDESAAQAVKTYRSQK